MVSCLVSYGMMVIHTLDMLPYVSRVRSVLHVYPSGYRMTKDQKKERPNCD